MRMGKESWFKLIMAIFVLTLCFNAFVIIGMDDSQNSTEGTGYTSDSSATSGKKYPSYSPEGTKCSASGCTNPRTHGSRYCSIHTCMKSGCNKEAASGSVYCDLHKNSTTGDSAHKNSGNTDNYDPYDVYDYENGDDFADEWAEEFGDGDYEDGYEDAYDYWENERE